MWVVWLLQPGRLVVELVPEAACSSSRQNASRLM
jgi:hypothetical protein